MGIEVQILVCMGGFSVYEKLNRTIRFASNQCVEEGDLTVFSDSWVNWMFPVGSI